MASFSTPAYLYISVEGIIRKAIRRKPHVHTVLYNRVGLHAHVEFAVLALVDAQLVREDLDCAVHDAVQVH